MVVFDEYLYYISQIDSKKSLVRYNLVDIIRRKCTSPEVVASDVLSFAWSNSIGSIMYQHSNLSLICGESVYELRNHGIGVIDTYLEINGKMLVSGYDSSSKMNIFVLLDSNLSVMDSAEIGPSVFLEGFFGLISSKEY